MNENSTTKSGVATLPLTTIGFITWIVFLVMKLCNQNNPDFNWLTWFWVWFPLWAPWALLAAIVIIIFVVSLIYALCTQKE